MHDTLDVVKATDAAVSVRYRVKTADEAWVLPEGTVPESVPHDSAAQELKLVLTAWADRTPRVVRVARNLAVRWLERAPRIGIDPDVCVLEPPPPDFEQITSLCLWKPGHTPPPVCFEVVSSKHPHKDYAVIQDRYAAMGTRELFVFDPLLAGPAALGGPVSLQVWRRDAVSGVFERVHFGDEAAYSEVLDAWVVPTGRSLVIADDRRGEHPWLTAEQRERAEKNRERAEKDRERAEKDRERAARLELERRVAELEAQGRRGLPQ